MWVQTCERADPAGSLVPLWPVVSPLIRYISPDKACGFLRRGPTWNSSFSLQSTSMVVQSQIEPIYHVYHFHQNVKTGTFLRLQVFKNVVVYLSNRNYNRVAAYRCCSGYTSLIDILTSYIH